MSSLFAVGTRPDAFMLGLTEKAAALGRERRLPVIAVCFWPELNGRDAAALAGCGAEVQHFIFSTESKSEAAEVIRAYREGRAPADPASVRRIK